MAVNGNFLALYVNGQRIALTKSDDFSQKMAMEDITNKDSNGNKEVMPTQKEASCSMEGIVTAAPKNMLQFPENIENNAWFRLGATVSGTRVEAPNGQMRGQTITWNTASSIGQNTTLNVAPNSKVTASIWVKGSGSVQIGCGDTNDAFMSATITLTSTWQRISFSGVLENGDLPYLTLAKVSGTAVTVAFPQLELGVLTDYAGSAQTLKLLAELAANRTQVAILHSDYFAGSFANSYNGFISDVQVKASNDSADTFTCNFLSTGSTTTQTI